MSRCFYTDISGRGNYIFQDIEARHESTEHVLSIGDLQYCLPGKCVGGIGDRRIGDNDLGCHVKQLVLYLKDSEDHYRNSNRE